MPLLLRWAPNYFFDIWRPRLRLAERDPDLWLDVCEVFRQIDAINRHLYRDLSNNYSFETELLELILGASRSAGQLLRDPTGAIDSHRVQNFDEEAAFKLLADKNIPKVWLNAFSLQTSGNWESSLSKTLGRKYLDFGNHLVKRILQLYGRLEEFCDVRANLEACCWIFVTLVAGFGATETTAGTEIMTSYQEITWQRIFNSDSTRRNKPGKHGLHTSDAKVGSTLDEAITLIWPFANIRSQMYHILLLSTFFSVSSSFLFVGLAWYHSLSIAGSTSDADFWTLLQNSAMQLLGLVSAVLPVARRQTETAHTWSIVTTWALTAVCLGSSIIAPILYLTVFTIWSAVVSFLGTLAQAFLVLQLALGANTGDTKAKAD